MKKNKKRLILVASILLNVSASASLWGCSELEAHDGPIEWDDTRTTGKVIGFIDDSLVIVSDWRGWSQELATFITNNGGYRTGIGHQGLRVYNYRVQENGPRWIDSLDNDDTESFTYLVGQLSDSVIWGGNGNDSFSFWKLSQRPTVVNTAVSKDGCNVTFKQEKMREWLNGDIILKGPLGASGDTCQYAVLDTVAKTITYKRLSDDLKWIEMCDDVRAWGEDVYCMMLDKNGKNSFIMKNGTDSIFTPMDLLHEGTFWGSMLELGVRICSFRNDVIVCSNVKWTDKTIFLRDDGTEIQLK